MDNSENDQLFLVGELFRNLLEKFNKLENKKRLYKGLDDLTLAEINTMVIIGRGKLISMSDIANSLGVSFGTPTVTIDRLIKKKYVLRIRDLEDRRQVFIKLSDAGEELLKVIIDLRLRIAEEIFGVLSKEERDKSIQLLTKINQNFEDVLNKS